MFRPNVIIVRECVSVSGTELVKSIRKCLLFELCSLRRHYVSCIGFSMFYLMFKYLILSLDCVIINVCLCSNTHQAGRDIL